MTQGDSARIGSGGAGVDAVIDGLFADPARTVRLAAGQILLVEGEPNRRLFRVRQGRMAGTVCGEDGGAMEVMRAGPGDLVGVQSFFGEVGVAQQTVTALETTELGFIERDMPIDPGQPSLERLLMPIILGELVRRQEAALEMADRERQTRERLNELQHVSALGQLAAGVAHELNNALTVLVRGTAWIAQVVQQRVDQREKVLHRAFDHGMAQGRSVSSAEARGRAVAIEKNFGLPAAVARKLAHTGLSDEQLISFGDLRRNHGQVVLLWEMGATMHDMEVAAEQADHVVRSMRDLGSRRAVENEPVDVNQTIRTALKMLRGQLSGVEVSADLGTLPEIRGSRGKLVQVWTNLVRNAVEAMASAVGAAGGPRVMIATRATSDAVVVTIDDVGPGIAPEVLPRIFEPSFSTKKKGLSFGLGLGLAIVQRLVAEHGGEIRASNTVSGARFTIRLPREVIDG